MAKQPGKTQAGTNVQHVRQKNQQSAAGQAGAEAFGTEFASETDAQQVRQQNAKAEQKKGQNS
ncbi:gamma-type small acid-soluble spore protein [Pseudalkalibacillus caeni]|uniref:Small, acid-soluble spore protein gamma-type n=1 Tax=Exobacillus caeni TaxID=2574798 RepID=A0A5R9F7F6_9BACL|nr:gamma-type small acid-soluble spore protein [Pseudalkalibacillus caeni]TLS35705.1 gamma-type small acid-soluble spore protein [Pseudalkalibacillus caeni]